MAVPNTNTFTLIDVKNEIESNGGSTVTSLTSAFTNANSSGFDPNYVGSKNSLLNFRNYAHSYLTITPLSHQVSASSGTVTYVISSNIAWTISDNAGWVTLSKSSGTGSTTVIASYQTNTSQLLRNCTITLAGGGMTRTVGLGQAGAVAGDIEVTPSFMNFFHNDLSNKLATVTAGVGVTWTVTKDSTWIHTSKTSGSGNSTFTVSVDYNNSTISGRNGIVYVTGGGSTDTIQITQAAATCLVKGSIITLSDGQRIPIETLSVGDTLLSADIHSLEDTNDIDKLYAWSSAALNTKVAESSIADIIEVKGQDTYIINDGLIEATQWHNQLILRGGTWMFKPFRELQIGDSLYDANDNIIPIISITKGSEKTVYKLTLTEPYHTFYGNGILTHNIK